MNLLKRISIVLSATLFLWGCSDSDEPVNEMNDSLSLSTNEIKINGLGGEVAVTVTSSDDWRLAGTYDWAHPSATSGKSGDQVTFTIDPNSLDEIRTATFKFFIGSTVVPLQVECSPVYAVDLLTEQKIDLPRKKSDVSIKFESNVSDLTITYSDDSKEWLTLEKQSEFIGKTTLLFSVAENETYKIRSADVTLESPLLDEPIVVNITQACVPYFTITPSETSQKYDLSEQTISFTVESNLEYTPSIVSGAEWITNQTISKQQTDDRGITTSTLSYKLLAASNARVGSVHVENCLKNAEISIVQADPNTPVASISNSVIAEYAETSGWLVRLAGNEGIITEAGMKATEFTCTKTIDNLNGLEYFPNLTTIQIKGSSSLQKVDISKLHKVTSLTITNTATIYMKEFNFGDNPITSFDLLSARYFGSGCEDLVFISDNLQAINMKVQRPGSDYVERIDLTQCPVLHTFKFNGEYVETLYLKPDQTIPNLELATKYKIERK